MTLLDGARVLPFGETAVVLEFGDRIDPTVHDLVLAADRAVVGAGVPGLEEVVPSYRSLLLRFDPFVTTPEEVVAAVGALAPVSAESTRRRVEVPFDVAGGEDLEEVVRRCGLPGTDDVVRLLTGGDLRVYLHGFAPGFAYLGGVPEELGLPRRETPRGPVPPGSVLLAAGQAALCPVAMPTGWWVVGRTSMQLFDPDASPPVPFAPGDVVRLVTT